MAGVHPRGAAATPAVEIAMTSREIDLAVKRERARCAEICRRRAETWRRTMARNTEEARARANEAAYLADLIESGTDLDEEPDA